MYKTFKLYSPAIGILLALCAVLVLVMAIVDRTLFFICASLTLVTVAIVLILLRRTGKRTRVMLDEIARGIAYTGENAFMEFPVPVITVYDEKEIIWYNDLCAERVFGGRDMRGELLSDVLPTLDIGKTSPPEGYGLHYGERLYTAYVAGAWRAGHRISVIYLIDDTRLKYYANEYHYSKPSIALIMVDNYEEMMQDYKDSERAQLMSEIEHAIEQYITDNHGFITRVERDRFLAVIEERGIQNIVAGKFGLLDQVRALHISDRMSATLSIGIGHEAPSLFESEAMARQALDMCLGRGGDQVAIKNQNGYEFYGGVSKGIEKRTKVKTRIIATALAELIESADNVILMGHRYADLDSLGSCMGMLRAVKAMNRTAAICIDKTANLVHPLLERLRAGGYPESDFIEPEQAMNIVSERTLLIVLDTHVPHVLESEALYRACKNVVVIDHHRKLVSYIDNAVIFYHEPFASSASEMVAELVQYFPARPQVTKLEAEAMLAGIMLDTKNFVLRTGVRTFEAAAYLRRLGADTVEVRRLFASSMDTYQKKASLVAAAEVYRRCAIAAVDTEMEDAKIIAPQAADELMSISGVDASFVVYSYEGIVNVSARSMGLVNVQVIMEKLGGGGHHTMAAAQFPQENVENVHKMVTEAIDSYYETLNKAPA